MKIDNVILCALSNYCKKEVDIFVSVTVRDYNLR